MAGGLAGDGAGLGDAPSDDAGRLRCRFRHRARIQCAPHRPADDGLLVLVVTVIGLKVVGLVLIVALLIIPPVAARFWTDQVRPHDLDRRRIGGVSGYVGAAVSASAPNLPTGPIIVLVRGGRSLWPRCSSRRRADCGRRSQATPLQGARPPAAGPAGLARQEPIREAYTLRLLQRSRACPRRRCPDGCGPCCRRQGRPRRTALGYRTADPSGCGTDRALQRPDPDRGRLHSRRNP
jgi:hypothetical protein